MFLSKPIPVVRDSNPLLSDSSIRRLKRHRNVPQRCRNQNAGLNGPMRRARLALRGRQRFPIGLSFLKDPKTSFREMARHGHLRLAVTSACFDSWVKLADMVVATTLAIKDRAVGRLHKGPLQINIDVATNRPVTEFPAAGVLACHQSAIARQLFGAAEAFNGSDLSPNHYCQDLAHPRQSLEQGGFGTRSKNLCHFGFDRFEILSEVIQLIEDGRKGPLGMRRKLTDQFHDDLTTALAKGIGCPLHHMSVLTQSGMHAVLKLGSLPAQHHTRAWQLACITYTRGRDPYRRQVPRSLQSVHPSGIELFTLVNNPHHQFSQPRVNQLRLSSASRNLIDHPIPVPHRLHRHGRSCTPALNKILNVPMSVRQPTLVQPLSLGILYPRPGIFLMNVQCDIFHNGSPPRSVILITAVRESISFILIRMTKSDLTVFERALFKGGTK